MTIDVRTQNESFFATARVNNFRNAKLEGPSTAENKDLARHEVFSFQEVKTESNELQEESASIENENNGTQ